jgi:hypothetical protein
MEDGARHLEGAPNPARARIGALDADLRYVAVTIEKDGVEQLGSFHRKQQERQAIIRQAAQGVIGEPDRVRQTDEHPIVLGDERLCAKDRIAETRWRRLHHKGSGR